MPSVLTRRCYITVGVREAVQQCWFGAEVHSGKSLLSLCLNIARSISELGDTDNSDEGFLCLFFPQVFFLGHQHNENHEQCRHAKAYSYGVTVKSQTCLLVIANRHRSTVAIKASLFFLQNI